MAGPVLTEAQKNNIQNRRQRLQEIQGICGAMQDLLNLVEAEARDENGDVTNPWLIGDADLSEAIAQWNDYKVDVAAKFGALP